MRKGMGDFVKILAIEKELPGSTEEGFGRHAQSEAARGWELYKAGVLREMYFRTDTHCAVLMLECGGLEEAREVLETLPLVREGFIAFDIIPLRPYDGFERLFAGHRGQ